MTITYINIERDVTSSCGVPNKGHAQRISTALGDTLREGRLLILLRLGQLLGIKVTRAKLVM